jgi:hypothetical protein
MDSYDIERLRDRGIELDGMGRAFIAADVYEAADEIERLRRELAELKDRIGDLQASEWQIGYEHGRREARCEAP